ncbi:MAG: FAD-dependent monooxygenase [Porticoccaceae bacterium]|nr:FAD-dependent monooxygenase [Porticoccaceae bacterium]
MSEVSNQHWHFAIVGAGLSGACLALLLAREQSQWNILLIDGEASTAEPDHRASALSASTIDVLQTMGLWSDLATSTAAITRIDVSDRGHIGSANLDANEQELNAFGHVVENAQLAEVFAQAFPAFPNITHIKAPAPSLLKPRQSGMGLLLEQGECLADLVVLAGGEQRPLAQQLGISYRSHDYQRVALVANLVMAEAHNGLAHERFTGDGAIALLPLPGKGDKRVSLVWTLPAERAEEMQDAGPEDFISGLNEQLGSRAGTALEVDDRQCFPVKKIIAAEQVRSHLLLLGNAAHSMHPVAGQGFNLSVRDMATLTELLSKAYHDGVPPGDLAVLQHYAKLRKDDQGRTIALSDKLPKLFGMDETLAMAARNLGLVTLDLLPPLRQGFARFGAGLMARRAHLRE